MRGLGVASFSIDSTSYNKAAHYPLYHGYGLRPGGQPTSIDVHSTNNSQPNTKFENEADYLYSSPDVSADFLIGKDGRIVQFLDSRKYAAWHAGGLQSDGTWTAQPDYDNGHAIGVELHRSTPDPPYPQIQIDALAWLLRQLVAKYAIAPTKIETHGQIAIAGPYIRKVDPNDWPHDQFIAWRDALFAVDPLKAKTIAGPPPTSAMVYCSVGAFNFYNTRGGIKYNGYPLKNMFHDASLNCDVLICERVIIKESAQFGVEQALLQEAANEGWRP